MKRFLFAHGNKNFAIIQFSCEGDCYHIILGWVGHRGAPCPEIFAGLNSIKITSHTIGKEQLYASEYRKNRKIRECILTKLEDLSNLAVFLTRSGF
jgi:hypothetical protein